MSNWGSKTTIYIYIEGEEIDSAHIIDAANRASTCLKDIGYKVAFTGASKGIVQYEPKESIAT